MPDDPRTTLLLVAVLIAMGVACLLVAGTPAPPAVQDTPAHEIHSVDPIPHLDTTQEVTSDA